MYYRQLTKVSFSPDGWLGLSAENRPKNDEAPRLLHFCIVVVEQTMHTAALKQAHEFTRRSP